MASDFELSAFLSNVPPALTLALVHLGPSISACRTAFQIFSWSTSWYRSWLALTAWWIVCLFIDKTLRRFFPVIIFSFFAYVQWRQKNVSSIKPPTSEHALRSVISDLTTIQALLPSLPSPSIPIPTLLRIAAILYIPYIALSFLVSFRVICALGGTTLLTWRAPWAIVLRATAWRSAWLRWSLYKIWAFLSGEPLPERIYSFQPSTDSLTPVQSLRFLFTIYENQRWWVGLDWTAALLPGERPSWCSSSHHPLSPPNAFSLPPNTTIYLEDEKGGKLKRTATWKWEEPEWRVVVRRTGGGLSRVERPLPSIKDESPNSSRLLKAASRLRDPGSNITVNSSSTFDTNKGLVGNTDVDYDSQDPTDTPGEEPLTDIDGWVYGDNKWEGQSNRGGMGKYTRYRRWTRVAVVFEEVETVSLEDSETLIFQEQERQVPTKTEGSTHIPETIIGNPPESPLKHRLRMALNKPPE
ncbi:Peroxisomal membrane protein PEX30 [Psilocybe cubensis]|uniref:Peroxin/Ferlin domain-containing protein n=2 Tax=Psilocybe cubensis TaxID=181762 RepID=A0A8H7Y5B6_PSICU|nr:Peroxisomal membrane protein PEX30 [Psilocybe cubensis]KAH9485290.1 Peroxisomal membrane protein PEX30 [Psilocybe cubensis]